MGNSDLTITHVPKTEADVLAAMQTFAITSIAVVGLDNTVDTLDILTQMVTNSPGIYQKLFLPENQAKFKQIFDKYDGKKKPSGMEIMALIPMLKKILEL